MARYSGRTGLVSAYHRARGATERQNYRIRRIYQTLYHRPCHHRHRVVRGQSVVEEKELVKYLDNYKCKFAVKSFNPLIVRWFKINRKDYIRGLLVPRNSKKLKKKIMSHMLLKPLCKPDFLSVDYRRNNKKLLEKSKIPIIVWTVKEDRSKFKELYGTIICDNLEGNKKC